MLPNLVLDFAAASIAAIPVAWLARFGFLANLRSLSAVANRSLLLIRSQQISDHWKEKAIPAYALKLFVSTIKLALYITGLLGAFVASYTGILFVLSGEFAYARLMNWETQGVVALAGIGLGLISWYRAK